MAEGRTINLANGFVTPEFSGKFPANGIRTSKYTPATFAPKNLFEQLHKFGNVYFLCISVLMYLGEKTSLFIGTIKAFSTLATLMMMMGVTALVAFLDDEQRKRSDRQTNQQAAKRFNGDDAKTGTANWEDVKVGDVLVVSQDEELPADIVVVFSSTAKGSVYVSTANLDGETNLKLKSAPKKIQEKLRAQVQETVFANLKNLEVSVEAEAPTNSIHVFEGRLLATGSIDESLSSDHILLRGTVLRNTPWVIGVVVYTGAQTRMVMNSREAPMKQSNLEKITNSVMLIVLGVQASMALVSDIIFSYTKANYRSHWYLFPPDLILPDWLAYWLTFFVLYSNMMPISLYPTMEACNSAQSYFIKNDKNMYYKELDFPAAARSTNLCQEIGQVKYVFSDKTGTLTQNVMELKKMSITLEVYGDVVEGQKGFNGAPVLKNKRQTKKGPEGDAIDAMLEVLAVAHTAMVAVGKDGKRGYEVESPDEGALVEAVADCGWEFASRDGDKLTVNVDGESPREYTLLATNEFNSTRKRMSVVVQTGDKAWVLCKGADNVMLARATKKEPELEKQLLDFSVEGLRTLVFARRELTPDELSSWQTKYNAALRQVGSGREEALMAAAELVEKDLEIVGATAIEDKLQDGVPDTIQAIRKAGVKLWVLTGDKLETAQNIGFSAKVLTNSMKLVIIDCGDDRDKLRGLIDDSLSDVEKAVAGGIDAGCMITGAALDVILPDAELSKKLLKIGNGCSVLIACRVSPLQKAEMVRLVRNDPELGDPVTLSIGDGANDVPMIQEAHVGIGIAGREGRQAVNNSDFAIGQFRYLQRLMLVHGRWNYRRVCKFTLFTFWRNAVQVLMIFYYTFISGFSGTSLFEDWIRLSFNFLCSFPIVATGVFDKDVDETVALGCPELYKVGRDGQDLNPAKMVGALLSAITHSLILLALTVAAFPSMDIHGNGDYYTFGTAVYSCLLLDMNYRALFITKTHNQWTIGSICASFLLYGFYLVVYPCSKFVTSLLAPNMYMVPYHMMWQPIFWLCILAVPALAITVDMFIVFLWQTFNPDTHQLFVLAADKVEREQITEKEAEYEIIASGAEENKGVDLTGKIDLSDFAQQATPSRRFRFSTKFVVRTLLFLGVLNMMIGGWALYCSASNEQIRIHYEGDATLGDPLGTQEFEVFKVQEKCAKQHPKPCKVQIKMPVEMKPPILLYYAIGPFYQNFNDYLKSEVTKELHGDNVPSSLRETMCLKPTRIDEEGKDIVPCGMKATSMFNDTFTIKDHHIDSSKLAWAEDMARYRNPEDYPDREKTSWLYQRYPDVVPKDEGVNNEQFLVWMRPSALWRVWNPYGYIHGKTIKKGDVLDISIESNYPMTPMNGWKQLVLTTIGPLGGRHHGFGYCILSSGVICLVFSALVFFIDCEGFGKRSQ